MSRLVAGYDHGCLQGQARHSMTDIRTTPELITATGRSGRTLEAAARWSVP